MDQSLRNAGVGPTRVTTIVARVASPDRSDCMNVIRPSTLRQLGAGPGDGPYETRQLTRHRGTHFVEMHAARAQSANAAAESQLRFPGDVANGLRQIFGAALRTGTDARLEAVVPCRLGQQPSRMRIT